MKVAEVFYSIQGEGPWMGVPCVFIRLSGCNLRCAWCDTPYASWNPEGKDWTMEELQARLSAWPQAPVVITGGEPFLFPFLPELCAVLRAEGRPVALETSGSLYRKVECDLVCISPKRDSSDPDPLRFPTEYARHRKARLDLQPLRSLLSDHRTAILKFVVASSADADDAQMFAKDLGIPASRVYLMPCATSTGVIQELAPQVAAWSLQYGFRYSDRLHVRLWGNEKGR